MLCPARMPLGLGPGAATGATPEVSQYWCQLVNDTASEVSGCMALPCCCHEGHPRFREGGSLEACSLPQPDVSGGEQRKRICLTSPVTNVI